MGTLLRSCGEVRRASELSFGMVSGVGPGIDVLDGGPRASRERAVSGIFSAFAPPICLNGRNDVLFGENISIRVGKVDNIFVRTTSLKSMFHWLSDDIVRFKIKVGVEEKCTKM